MVIISSKFLYYEKYTNWITNVYIADDQPSPDEIQASQHPKLLKYFKMEKVGVPAPAIKGKMKVEGIDPSLLDDPDKFIRKDAFGMEEQEEENSSSGDDYWN